MTTSPAKTAVIRTIGTAAAMSVLVAGLVAANPAQAKGSGAVTVRGTCSTTHTLTTLKARPRNGLLEVELEVDSSRNGQRWVFTLRHDGVRKLSGRRTTLAPSGSFSVATRMPDVAGVHRISATARNLTTGETCAASLRI